MSKVAVDMELNQILVKKKQKKNNTNIKKIVIVCVITMHGLIFFL